MPVKTGFTKKEHVDSGLALLLLTLLSGLLFNQSYAQQIALAEVLVMLTLPVLLYPFTFLWLNLSDLLGKVMSKVLLTIIFIVLVCPVAIFRRAIGKDILQLKKFKNDDRSVFTDRHHDYIKSDFTAPY